MMEHWNLTNQIQTSLSTTGPEKPFKVYTDDDQ
jgi:hypothetical protein